jgi:hypothetical protein
MRVTRPRGLVAIVVATGLVLSTTPAWGTTSPPSPTGGLTGGNGGASAGATAPGASGQPVSYGGPPAAPSNDAGDTWKIVGTDQTLVCFDNGTSAPYGGPGSQPPDPPPGALLVGPNPYPLEYQLFDPQGNTVGPVQDVCPVTGASTPPPPPTPPSPAEVVAYTPFPVETIHHVPCYMG